MLKGFYTLTSGMLTQNRVLNTISNNMANSTTPGFKKDTLVSTTFQEELLYRTGNKDKTASEPLAKSSMIRKAEESVTSYEQGPLKDTERTLDFAIQEKGFFEIQTEKGNYYTRNGSFTLDNEGYLSLQHVGRVMGDNGPILLNTDKVTVDSQGTILSQDGEEKGMLKIVDFKDYAQLTKVNEGMFQNSNAQNIATNQEYQIKSKTLEGSNVNPMDEMVAMMSSQRALQSASQLLKMYDQLMAKAVTEIGKI